MNEAGAERESGDPGHDGVGQPQPREVGSFPLKR